MSSNEVFKALLLQLACGLEKLENEPTEAGEHALRKLTRVIDFDLAVTEGLAVSKHIARSMTALVMEATVLPDDEGHMTLKCDMSSATIRHYAETGVLPGCIQLKLSEVAKSTFHRHKLLKRRQLRQEIDEFIKQVEEDGENE